MSRVPRVAAIHDLSGLGRCSLSVVLPVLSAMGAQCCPMPTAVLSAHTAYPLPDLAYFQDLTGGMARTAAHWRALETDFDAVYSGFLASEAQIDVLEGFLRAVRARTPWILVDPVMGDQGRPYRTCTPELCRRMGELAALADLITPNLTEAALLLGEPYGQAPTDQAGIGTWLRRLSLEGRRSVVITGVSLAPGVVGAGCFDRQSGAVRFAMARQERGHFPGTGDLFAAVVLGGLLRGEPLAEAVARAVDLVQKCVAYTLEAGTPAVEGVQFEGLMREFV